MISNERDVGGQCLKALTARVCQDNGHGQVNRAVDSVTLSSDKAVTKVSKSINARSESTARACSLSTAGSSAYHRKAMLK